MPTPPDPDGPTDWVKGDLPAEQEAIPASTNGSESEPAPEAAPADAEAEQRDTLAKAYADALAETAALSDLFAAVADELIAVPPAGDVTAEPQDEASEAAGAAGLADLIELEAQEPQIVTMREAEAPPPIELPIIEPLGLEALIESLLFVAEGAVPVAQLAEALEASTRDVEAALASLAASYGQRGLNLQRFRDKVQLTTSPAAAGRVERFLGLAALTPLSRAALESLAIVAYQQPVTRPQIEAIRGVNSDSVIKNLLSKGLIEESGRAEGPGRPVLYSTTPEFMQHFGLSALADLPPLALPQATATLTHETILKG